MITVLFACVHNAGRSQMAAALFNALAPASLKAVSAGTEPADRVQSEVVAAMDEVGIDLRSAVPRKLDAELSRQAQVLVTMGCGEACPYLPGIRRLDWPLPDPKSAPPKQVREIRDDIRRRVVALIQELQDV